MMIKQKQAHSSERTLLTQITIEDTDLGKPKKLYKIVGQTPVITINRKEKFVTGEYNIKYNNNAISY